MHLVSEAVSNDSLSTAYGIVYVFVTSCVILIALVVSHGK